MIKIEKNIPIPTAVVRRARSLASEIYKSLELNDSVAIEPKLFQSTRVGLLRMCKNKREGREFLCRKTEDGHRIWRIS